MKLSLVFELLLIFILLAFAASKSVKHEKHQIKKISQRRQDSNVGDKVGENNINKYCKCVERHCNCCRDFRLPVVELNGPGCASLMYLNGDRMSVSLSFGKKVITNRTLSSRKPSPVCMPLPGGLSKFCGRVYNIARAGEEFRACLGLELQSKKTVEAAVRVSCFKFGPRGVTSEPADPLPLVPQDEKTEDDDEDDDYDDDAFGLGGDDDDDDDEDDDDDDDGTIDAVNDIDSADYTGFSLLGDDLLGDLFGSTDSKKPKKKPNVKKQVPITKATTTTTTTKRPRTRRPTRKPNTRTTTLRPSRTTTTKVRPSGNRRPTRRPSNNRRPTRKPTTEITITTALTTPVKPSVTTVSATVQTTEMTQTMNTNQGDNAVLDPVNDENSASVLVLAATTPKSVTTFDDSGLEMSLAHITGQLSAMPVTPMVAEESKQAVMINKPEEPVYEKIKTITPKTPSTLSFGSTSIEADNKDLIQIVDNLDSFETTPENEPVFGEDSRGHNYHSYSFLEDDYEGLTAPKKPKNKQFDMDDLDVLNLSKIGESIGDELGIFGKNKKNQDKIKIKEEKDKNDDYDDLADAIGHTLMMRKSDKGHRKDRRRQNKMMRGEWSSQS